MQWNFWKSLKPINITQRWAKRNYTQIQEAIYKSEAPTLFNYSNPDSVHHDKVWYYAIHKNTGYTLVPNVFDAQYALES